MWLYYDITFCAIYTYVCELLSGFSSHAKWQGAINTLLYRMPFCQVLSRQGEVRSGAATLVLQHHLRHKAPVPPCGY